MPQISIIMPVYNAAIYLEECLESIRAQTYTDWELLAVDDYSTDLSSKILNRYAAADSRIQVLPNTRKGIIPALQNSYLASTGDYVTRMDADDIMHPQKIEKLYNAISGSVRGVAVGGVEYFSDSKSVENGYQRYATWLNQLLREGTSYTEIYKECVIPSPCWMMSRETFDQIGGFETDRYPEDYDLAFRMYRSGVEIRPVLEAIHRWRDHGERASRTDANYADQSFLPLKIHYFRELEWQPDIRLALWGAGKAGKAIAKELLTAKIRFDWYTDNTKKVDQDIYGVILQPVERLRVAVPDLIITAIRTPNFRQTSDADIETLERLGARFLHFH